MYKYLSQFSCEIHGSTNGFTNQYVVCLLHQLDEFLTAVVKSKFKFAEIWNAISKFILNSVLDNGQPWPCFILQQILRRTSADKRWTTEQIWKMQGTRVEVNCLENESACLPALVRQTKEEWGYIVTVCAPFAHPNQEG